MEQYDVTPAERWEHATLANNFIFYKVMRHHPEVCRKLLELLLDIEVERIELAPEETIAVAPEAKGVRLDVFGWHLPVYTFENRCLENGDIRLGDRTYKHFFIAPLCATLLEHGERRSFFALFTGGTPSTDFTDTLSQFVSDAKQNIQWRQQYMTWERQQRYAREAGFRAGEEKGKREGKLEGVMDVARRMRDRGMPLDEIAQLVQLPVEELSKALRSERADE